MGAIARQHRALLYNIPFKATVQTLRTIAADPKHLDAQTGFIATLEVNCAFGTVAAIEADIPLDGGWVIGLDVHNIFVKFKVGNVLPARGALSRMTT